MRNIRLLATDLDGTLLRDDKTISLRTRRALERVRAVGIEIVLVTGRPPRFLRTVAEELGIPNIAICGNGALIYDPTEHTIIRHTPIAPALAVALVTELRAAAPGVCFAFEREMVMGCEPGYLTALQRTPPPDILLADALALCEQPISKLIAVHPEMPVEALLPLAQRLAAGRALATYSGAPFVEMSAPEAQKSLALAWLCAQRGIQPDEVIAFGDMPNDLPMLRWAGHSVAMANAHPDVLAAADEITLSNEEDGVAVVLERLFDR
jgi:hydroxymethylpyrimidine pyrophosphatase-like HAD family hydrolase